MDTTDMTSANATLFGLAVTYTPPRGTAVTVAAALWDEREPTIEDHPEHGRLSIRRTRCKIRTADVARPVRLATVTRDGEIWNVEGIRQQGDWHELELTQVLQVEASPAYRKA